MGILAKLFGTTGTIRFEGTTYGGEAFTGKSGIECFGLSKEEIEEHIKNEIFVQTGKRIRTLNIIAFSSN